MFSENERETNLSSVDWEIVSHLMRFRNKSLFYIESLLELQRAPADKGTIMGFLWTISHVGLSSNDIGPL